MCGILSSHDPNDACGPFTFKVWLETEEINDENDHYERGSEPIDVVVGLRSQAEADEAVKLLSEAPTLARDVLKKFSEVVGALDGELTGLDCLSKFGDYCANASDHVGMLAEAEFGTEADDLCAVCSHGAALDDTTALLDTLTKLADLAGEEEVPDHVGEVRGFEGDE